MKPHLVYVNPNPPVFNYREFLRTVIDSKMFVLVGGGRLTARPQTINLTAYPGFWYM